MFKSLKTRPLFVLITSFLFINSHLLGSEENIPSGMNKYPTMLAGYYLKDFDENGIINVSSRVIHSVTATFVVAEEDIEILYKNKWNAGSDDGDDLWLKANKEDSLNFPYFLENLQGDRVRVQFINVAFAKGFALSHFSKDTIHSNFQSWFKIHDVLNGILSSDALFFHDELKCTLGDYEGYGSIWNIKYNSFFVDNSSFIAVFCPPLHHQCTMKLKPRSLCFLGKFRYEIFHSLS